MDLQPLGYRVLVKRKLVKKVGSIIVPESSREAKVAIGEVVAIGPDVSGLEVGNLITFGKYAPHNVESRDLEMYGIDLKSDADFEYLLMNEEDALCLLV